MPTVILLDVSLSMARFASGEHSGMKMIDLATSSIINFFDQLSQHAKLEYTSLVVFSSLYEVVIKFTRDFEALKKACNSVTTYDKTVFETAFQGIEVLVMEEWGSFVPIELILVTDGHSGIGDGSLKDAFQKMNERIPNNRFPIPFSFPCHLNVVCLSNDVKDKSFFEKLVELNYKKGDIYVPESLSLNGLRKCFNRLISTRYGQYETKLTCGHFQSTISVFPSPMLQNSFSGLSNLYKHPSAVISSSQLKLNSCLKILGFLDLLDFSHPAYYSRHLITPVSVPSEDLPTEESNGIVSSIFSGNKPKEISFQPSFCVLLHGSLKTEKMGAIVEVR